jgi:rhodanese-related sulfurtransferase
MELKVSAAALVDAARARIEEIEAAALIARHGDPDTVIVDIRDIRELEKTGRIPGAVHAPRGMLEFWVDPASPYFRSVFAQDGRRFVLHCAAGWRSALAAAALNDMGFACAHLAGGFTAWREAGGPIEQLSSEPWG